MQTVEDAKLLILQKVPAQAGSRGFPALVEALIDSVGDMIWKENKWSFAKKTKAPPEREYISFVPGTYEYVLDDDFLYPIYVWCKDRGEAGKMDILTQEQLRNRYPDYTAITGYPEVCTFEGIRKMQTFGDTAGSIGLIYQREGGASDLLSQDKSFLFIIIDGVLTMIHKAGSVEEASAFNRFWQRLNAKKQMDASHFEPSIFIQPDKLFQQLQTIRRSYQ